MPTPLQLCITMTLSPKSRSPHTDNVIPPQHHSGRVIAGNSLNLVLICEFSRAKNLLCGVQAQRPTHTNWNVNGWK
jgi:hypothetical protein